MFFNIYSRRRLLLKLTPVSSQFLLIYYFFFIGLRKNDQDTNTGLEYSSSSESDSTEEFVEEEAIRYYFTRGFEYKDIISILEKHHNFRITYRTLLRRLKQYGLSKKLSRCNGENYNILQRARTRINEIMNGPGSCGGYRTVWHTLEMEGIRVPRMFVQCYLKERDPEASENRRRHRLKRRQYRNRGPNFVWHIDGYDKLKPWGFPIYGAIDGFSRKILWLKVTRSNNSPDSVALFFVKTVETYQGCPVELVTDLGTENGLSASIQCFFRDNGDAHRYVPSPRNQRIEAWWSQLCKQRTTWWRAFFSDLESHKVFDGTSEIHREALWYSFYGLFIAK